MQKPNLSLSTSLAILATLSLVTGCGDAIGPDAPGGVSLSAAGVGPELDPGTTIEGSSLVQNDTNGTLVLTLARVVVKEIELEGDNDVEEFERGPILLDLALDGGVDQELEVMIPPGVYDELEFEIDKADDEAFASLNPDFAEVSVRVEGTYNGDPFVLTLDIDEETELDLDPPLVVLEGDGRNVTLIIDLSQWFIAPDGSVIDPRTAGSGHENEGLVKDNIKRSIQAFEDDDRDGDRDDD